MHLQEGSHVYEFNPVLDTITLIQQLPDTDVLKVVHYSDLHDDKHYVLLLSRDSGKIYWWRSKMRQNYLHFFIFYLYEVVPFDRTLLKCLWLIFADNQLQKWQELEYSESMEPSSVGILTLHNLENIIIISNGVC